MEYLGHDLRSKLGRTLALKVLLVVRLCFMSDIVLLIDGLYCIDLFSCISARLFNKLTYLLTGQR